MGLAGGVPRPEHRGSVGTALGGMGHQGDAYRAAKEQPADKLAGMRRSLTLMGPWRLQGKLMNLSTTWENSHIKQGGLDFFFKCLQSEAWIRYSQCFLSEVFNKKKAQFLTQTKLSEDKTSSCRGQKLVGEKPRKD